MTEPNDPNRPDVSADRPADQGLTPDQERKAVAATAAGGLGCLAFGFGPYIFIALALALLLVLGVFRGGCTAGDARPDPAPVAPVVDRPETSPPPVYPSAPTRIPSH